MTTMTASQRRQQERADYLAMMERCASRQVIDTLSDKWATLLLHALADGPLRRGELARDVVGASPKMLTQTLRTLERDGIVSRTVIPAVPVNVEYELTELGRSFHALVCGIRDWSESHIGDIHEARGAYDEAHDPH
jgi:DNA-binding HxlR family transcriptional regulator